MNLIFKIAVLLVMGYLMYLTAQMFGNFRTGTTSEAYKYAPPTQVSEEKSSNKEE